MLFCCFVAFWGNSQRTSLTSQKKKISETSTEILRKFVFLTMFEKWQILRKIWICLNIFFYQTSKRGHILTKTVFHPKLCHIQLNCFSVVLKHFRGNSQRTFLFSQKSDYLRNEHWNTQKVCFSYHVWKVANPVENLDLFKQLFFIKPVKRDKL